MPKNQLTTIDGPRYRSGAVSRLSGIPVETLRVWERRYNVVGPRQSPTGQRLYTGKDVARLTVIKQLVDAGHAIGSVASLQIEELESMLNQAIDAAFRSTHPGRAHRHAGAAVAGQNGGSPLRVAIVGDALALRMGRLPASTLRIVAVAQNLSHAFEEIADLSADVLLVEAPTVPAAALQGIRELSEKLGVRRIVVEYGFTAKRARQELTAMGCALVPAPLSADRLTSLCAALPETAQAGSGILPVRLGPIAPPRFDNRMLAEISMAAVTLKCECPHHLSDLLARLGNFETYSGECEHDSPADAALHHYLQQVAGTARALLEPALIRVAEFEGIPLR